MGALTECWSRDGQCRDDEVCIQRHDIAEERDDSILKTPQVHVKRITGFTTSFSGSHVTEQEDAQNPSTRHREVSVPNLGTPTVDSFHQCNDHAADVNSPFYNNTLGDVFGLLESSSEGQAIAGCHGTVARRRASTSLLSEDLERLSSRMKTDEQSNFETQMSKLKCLSIRKESDVDITRGDQLSRTLSSRGMPGELRIQVQKKKARKTQHRARQQQSPGTAGSSGSEAMPIPHMSRACTAPDQLPELSSSMLESILLERDKEEKKNKSPTGATLSTPNGEERRMHVTGRRVPSAAFLDDLAALQERQYSVFRNDSEKRSTRHHLYST